MPIGVSQLRHGFDAGWRHMGQRQTYPSSHLQQRGIVFQADEWTKHGSCTGGDSSLYRARPSVDRDDAHVRFTLFDEVNGSVSALRDVLDDAVRVEAPDAD